MFRLEYHSFGCHVSNIWTLAGKNIKAGPGGVGGGEIGGAEGTSTKNVNCAN